MTSGRAGTRGLLPAALAAAAGLASAQPWVIEGQEAAGRFGEAICALDFNADGAADLIVGEPGWNRVWCYLGGAEFDTTADLAWRGTAGTQFGACLAAIGDINADGIDDLAVGAPRDNNGGAGAGRVYCYFGSASTDTIPDLVITGSEIGGRFGASVAGRFDVDGDSICDLLIGAPGAQRAFLFLGGPGIDTVPELTLRDGNGDYFGGAVASVGDVTADDTGDILVGDYRHSGPILHGGGCFLYQGGCPPDPVLDQLWEGDDQNRQLGVALCAPGDLNGDGTNDLAFAGSYTATVELRFGGSRISGPADVVLRGNTRFGSSLDGGHDVNGDNSDDLLVGADGDDLGQPTGPGFAYLFLGGDPMNTTPDTVFEGERDGDMYGSSVALLGDINLDLRQDFAVGAPGHDARGSNAGRVYVHSAGDVPVAEPAWAPAPVCPRLRASPGPLVRRGRIVTLSWEASVEIPVVLRVFDATGRRARAAWTSGTMGDLAFVPDKAGLYFATLTTTVGSIVLRLTAVH